MPRTSFASLPDNARLWVFACDPAPSGESAARLLAETDAFLDRWQAHGNPLSCARDWRDGRFLAVAVDQSTEGASGCSIDGLFRALRSLEGEIGSKLVSGGSVFYRDAAGEVRCVSRDEFSKLAEQGAVAQSTKVFDTTVTTSADWRQLFERDAAISWHASLFPARSVVR